jgi:hypothetical protein
VFNAILNVFTKYDNFKFKWYYLNVCLVCLLNAMLTLIDVVNRMIDLCLLFILNFCYLNLNKGKPFIKHKHIYSILTWMVFVSIWKMFVWISGIIVYYEDESIMELKQHAILKAIASLYFKITLYKGNDSHVSNLGPCWPSWFTIYKYMRIKNKVM